MYEDEHSFIYEFMGKSYLEKWESGKAITREEWERFYEGFCEKYLYDLISEEYDIDPDDGAWELRDYNDVNDLADAGYGVISVLLDKYFEATDEQERELYAKLRYMVERTITRAKSLPSIADAAFAGDWDKFSSLVQLYPHTINDAFRYFYAGMPQEYRRDFVVGCYVRHGDSDFLCRLALRNLPRNGASELPEEYRDAEEVTVYRAGEEPIEEAPERISWTLSEDKARWFMNEYGLKHASHLYRAHIKPQDVIGYTNDREEEEVLQYRGVFDIEELA